MKNVNNARGQKATVTNNGSYLYLGVVIAKAWKDYTRCDMELLDDKLIIEPNMVGEYSLCREGSGIRVCIYSIKDRVPRFNLKPELDNGILTIRF